MPSCCSCVGVTIMTPSLAAAGVEAPAAGAVTIGVFTTGVCTADPCTVFITVTGASEVEITPGTTGDSTVAVGGGIILIDPDVRPRAGELDLMVSLAADRPPTLPPIDTCTRAVLLGTLKHTPQRWDFN